jgi:hypothetical protein
MKQLLKSVILVCISFLMIYAQSQNLPTSLHGTRIGKQTFYEGTTEQPGLYSITGVHIDSLGCKMCHSGTMMYQDGESFTTETYDPLDCNNCHDGESNVAQPDACKTCHGRIGKQEMLGMTDYHMAQLGFKCTSCHSSADIHGDGNQYASMLDEVDLGNENYDYPIDADCEDCHTNLPSNNEHDQHLNDIHCSTCHTAQVITCYNCHFNQMVDSHKKVAHKALKGFMLIAHRTGHKYNGKIWPVSFQSIYFKTEDGKDSTFVTFVPYYSHNVVPKEEAKTCSDCHNNANVQDYLEDNILKIAYWDDVEGTIMAMQGVIPFPEDYLTALKMDFVVQDTATGTWSLVGESTPDLIQNLGYIAPLTAAEIKALSTPMDIDDVTPVAKGFELKQNYPNPFNPSTTIEFFVPKAAKVSLIVYNVLGEEVARILDHQRVKAGVNRVVFDASQFNSGIYFYKLIAKDVELTRKMVLVK